MRRICAVAPWRNRGGFELLLSALRLARLMSHERVRAVADWAKSAWALRVNMCRYPWPNSRTCCSLRWPWRRSKRCANCVRVELELTRFYGQSGLRVCLQGSLKLKPRAPQEIHGTRQWRSSVQALPAAKAGPAFLLQSFADLPA